MSVRQKIEPREDVPGVVQRVVGLHARVDPLAREHARVGACEQQVEPCGVHQAGAAASPPRRLTARAPARGSHAGQPPPTRGELPPRRTGTETGSGAARTGRTIRRDWQSNYPSDDRLESHMQPLLDGLEALKTHFEEDEEAIKLVAAEVESAHQ